MREKIVKLKHVVSPELDNSGNPIFLSDETMELRKNKVLESMKKNDLDALVIYNDLEHGRNFEYLTGFLTRFEEGLLVLHKTGESHLILGNENTKMVNHSRIKSNLIHCPLFSLPNQPMENEKRLEDVFSEAGLVKGMKTGIVGWKLFTSTLLNNRKLFDVSEYMVKALINTVGEENLENRTDLFIHPEYGVRVCNNANEIAYYEFGSSLASDGVLTAINQMEIGKTEMEVASDLVKYGQHPTVVTICATGDRFEKANLYPSNKKIKSGDKFSMTVGFKGGLASRAGYVAKNDADLPDGQQDYIEKAASHYFNSIATWLENIKIGIKGKEIYSLIEEILPKEKFNWHLNPGHLTADEEWMSSPIMKDSEIELQSGMLLQIDIIPSVPGYAGTGCENGIALADKELREAISKEYPELWERIEKRRIYLNHTLGIELHESVLPLSSGVAYYTPFFLDNQLAFVVEKES